eukprot:237832-Prorocentrum_minimum.AAC.2
MCHRQPIGETDQSERPRGRTRVRVARVELGPRGGMRQGGGGELLHLARKQPPRPITSSHREVAETARVPRGAKRQIQPGPW